MKCVGNGVFAKKLTFYGPEPGDHVADVALVAAGGRQESG